MNRQCRAMVARMIVLLLTAAGAATAGGCGGTVRRALVFDKGPAVSAMAVDVDNFQGNVTIHADPNATNILIKARLKAREPFPHLGKNLLRAGPLDRSLDLVDVAAELVTDENGFGVLRVTSTTTFERPDIQWVDLRIIMPEIDGVRVQTSAGNVDLVNVHGAVTVVNHWGNVMLRSDRPMTAPVSITAADGRISYRVRAESTGQFDLEALNGRADFRALYGTVTAHQRGESRLIAQLGDSAANPVVLRCSNGDIKVLVTDDPLSAGPLDIGIRPRPGSQSSGD